MKDTNIVSKTLCIYDRQVLAHTQGGMGVTFFALCETQDVVVWDLGSKN